MFDKKEYRRQYYIKNKEKALKRNHQYYQDNYEKIKEINKIYRENHCEERKEYKRRYYIKNKDNLLKISKEYYENNKERCLKCRREYSKIYRKNNPEKIKERHQRWYINNLEKVREYRKQYREKNPNYMKEYSKNNSEKRKEYMKKYNENYREQRNQKSRDRRKIDLKFNLNRRISGAILKSLKGNKAGRRWESLVGYTLKDLVKRLKKTMPEVYTWQDFLDGKLHIDHKIPVSAHNYTKAEHIDFKRCWALKNLQLLPAKENMIKYNKLNRPFQSTLLI